MPARQQSPTPARQVVLRDFPQLRAARVAHRVVYEADVRAPAGTPAVNLAEFLASALAGPQRAEVVVEVRQPGETLAQLARAHTPVVVNDRGRLARRAGERPR